MPEPRRRGRPSHVDRFKVEERRRIVAENILASRTCEQVAEALDVPLTTIYKDRQIILARWREAQLKAVEEHVLVHEQKLERLASVYWAAAATGDKDAWDRVLKALESHRKLLGLDAAVKSDVSLNVETADSLDRKIADFAARGGTEPVPIEPDAA